jgi:hypothetical protein
MAEFPDPDTKNNTWRTVVKEVELPPEMREKMIVFSKKDAEIREKIQTLENERKEIKKQALEYLVVVREFLNLPEEKWEYYPHKGFREKHNYIGMLCQTIPIRCWNNALSDKPRRCDFACYDEKVEETAKLVIDEYNNPADPYIAGEGCLIQEELNKKDIEKFSLSYYELSVEEQVKP